MVNPSPPPEQPPRSKFWQACRTIALSSAVLTAAIVGARELGWLQPLELNAFDQLVRLHPDEKPDPRLLVVGITEEDLRRYEYPVSNKTLKNLLEKLEQAEPRAIGLDIVRDASIKTDREELLEFMQGSDVLVAVCKVRDQAGGKISDAGFPPPDGLDRDQIAMINLGVDPDGILRRAILSITPPPAPASDPNSTPLPADVCSDANGEAVPYMGLILALRYLDAQKVPIQISPQAVALGSTVFKPMEPNAGPYRSVGIGGQNGYQIPIRFRSATNPAQTVSLTEVLEGKIRPEQIKDRIVLVGYTARSVKDELFTPYGQRQDLPPMPGVVAHAQVTSQILSAVLDSRSLIWFWNPWLERVWILGWAIAGGLIAWKLRRPLLLLPAIVLAPLGLLIVGSVLFAQGGWIPLVPPLLAFLGTTGSVVVFTRGVAQAIYANVKGWLKLDIEIDESRKEQDVKEIVETDYFKELETKSQKLRQQSQDFKANGTPRSESNQEPSQESTMIDPTQPSQPTFKSVEIPSLNDRDTEELSFLQRVQRKSQQLRQQRAQEPDPDPEPLVVEFRPDIAANTSASRPIANLNIDVIDLFDTDPANQPPIEDIPPGGYPATPAPPAPPAPPAKPAQQTRPDTAKTIGKPIERPVATPLPDPIVVPVEPVVANTPENRTEAVEERANVDAPATPPVEAESPYLPIPARPAVVSPAPPAPAMTVPPPMPAPLPARSPVEAGAPSVAQAGSLAALLQEVDSYYQELRGSGNS